MKHLLNNLSNEEKNSIREQHTGGMKVITENFNRLMNAKLGNVKPLINEASQSEMMAAISAAKSKVASGDGEPGMEEKIKECITNKQLTSLMLLTTGAGSYALGIVAALCVSGVGSIAGLTLAMGGAIILFITGLSEKDGGLGADPSRDVKALLSCLGL